MFVTLLILFALASTPVASPVSINFAPDTTVALAGEPMVSPLVTADMIIVSLSSGDVVALSPSGQILWDTSLPAPASDTLVQIGDTVIVPGEDGTLSALDRDSGEIVEALTLSSHPLLRPIAVAGDIFIGDVRGTIHLVDSSTYRETDAVVVGSELHRGALLIGDTLVVVADTRVVTAIDTHTLAISWQSVLTDRVSAIATTPTNEIVVGGEGGLVTQLAPTGDLLWVSVAGSAPVMDVMTTDAGVVVALEDGLVVEFDSISGTMIWQSVAVNQLWFGADSCRSICPVVTRSGIVGTLDATSGAIEQITALPAEATVAPVLADGWLVIPLMDGTLMIWNMAAA